MRSNIIEIAGPPGIGKTTLYNAICKTWHSSYPWTFQNAVLFPEPPVNQLKRWLIYKTKKILKGDVSKSISSDFGLRFSQRYPELADFCWDKLSASAPAGEAAGLRYRAISLLYHDFCRYQAIVEKEYALPCLLNEGLLQKSFLGWGSAEDLPDLLNNYLCRCPLPVALISVSSDDPGIILQRLKDRKKVIAAHVGKEANDLLIDINQWKIRLRLIESWMLKHHVPVYNIDGGRPIRANVSLLTQLLKDQTNNVQATPSGPRTIVSDEAVVMS